MEHIGTFVAPLSLSTGTGEISPRRLDLLAAIGETGSISAAAKAVGMTYKAAWDAVEAMNNLAGLPLVTAQHGGRGGGGAVLSETGQQLVRDLSRLRTLQQAFLQQVEKEGVPGESRSMPRCACCWLAASGCTPSSHARVCAS